MFKLTSLGSGSAFSSDSNNTSGYFISNVNSFNLIDCGETVFKKVKPLLKKNKKLNIFITHMHSDHIGSLPTLIFYCHYVLNTIPNIYFPDKKNLMQFLGLNGVSENFYVIHNDVLTYTKVDDFLVKFIPVKHVETLNSYSLSFEKHYENSIQTTMFYSGDMSEFPIPPQDIEKYSYIYLECCLKDYPNNVHMPISKICGAFNETQWKNITLMHFDNKELKNIVLLLGFEVL